MARKRNRDDPCDPSWRFRCCFRPPRPPPRGYAFLDHGPKPARLEGKPRFLYFGRDGCAWRDHGGARFGPDRKAQDSFGDAIAPWPAGAAGNRGGGLGIAWDDDRDGTANIWLTRHKADGTYADNV